MESERWLVDLDLYQDELPVQERKDTVHLCDDPGGSVAASIVPPYCELIRNSPAAGRRRSPCENAPSKKTPARSPSPISARNS